MPFFVHYNGMLLHFHAGHESDCSACQDCFPNTISKCQSDAGWHWQFTVLPLAIINYHFHTWNWMPVLWKIHKHDRWNPTLPPLLGCLTHSPALYQDSKNIHAIAYLCFLLFHVIVVPIVSFLSWFMHCFSIDYAITEVATSDLRTFQLIAKIHKTSEKKRILERETIIAFFHCCIL